MNMWHEERLLVDGELAAFCEEERFSRVKHSPRTFPHKAMSYCLQQAGLSLADIDEIAIGMERHWATVLPNLWPLQPALFTYQKLRRNFREIVAGDKRMPFASPGDPVVQARIDSLRENGGNPFRDEQLPQAVITLKQGIGRLIRDVGDRGVLVLCDPRLTGKSYGKVFLKSLPPMSRTRKLEKVQAFFAAEHAGEPEAAGGGA